MKRRNGILIFLFCVALFLSSFIYGYRIMDNRINKRVSIVGKGHKKDEPTNNSELEILKKEDKISPNTSIEKKVYYKTCGHSIITLKDIDDEAINMTEEQYKTYMKTQHPNIKIISFSFDKIVLEEERDHMCQNHYIIGQSNGKIAIYGIDENGNEFLDRVFNDYSISLLKEIDQKKLIKGIVVDSEEELSNVLENFIS